MASRKLFDMLAVSVISQSQLFVHCIHNYADDRVTLDFGRALQQARASKGWTQKELATVSVDYRSACRSIPMNVYMLYKIKVFFQQKNEVLFT